MDSKKRKLPQAEAPEDGFADAMSKILAQPLTGTVNPVMAKRTTGTMRAIDQQRVEDRSKKEADREKRLKAAKNVVLPDHSTTSFEKQLKKIATSGGEIAHMSILARDSQMLGFAVVTLFNAIQRHQKDNSEPEEKSGKSKAGLIHTVSKLFVSSF
jgi:hypothetical protein